MRTSEGSQTLPVALPQSAALQKEGARRKVRPLAPPPAIWPGKRTWLWNCDDRMASAGGKDCSNGAISMAAEKKPDARAAHSIALPRPRFGHRCFFLAPGRPRLYLRTPLRRAMASSSGGSMARNSKKGAARSRVSYTVV
jgi:hypothetical protein